MYTFSAQKRWQQSTVCLLGRSNIALLLWFGSTLSINPQELSVCKETTGLFLL